VSVDIAQWLEDLGLGGCAKSFADHDIDFQTLPHLTDEDFRELGLSLGHRRILLAAIADLPKSGSLPHSGTKARPLADEAERRPLTVMFCDLVGSTALSEGLDPEDMREVIQSYHDRVTKEIAHFEGHVAKFMGDGVLAYFGWPHAHEDDAERAVQAGLSTVKTIGALTTPTREPLQVRIGIATGLVVVGDLIGEGPSAEESVVGMTPNLAARLQSMAAVNQVLIGDSTRELLGERFVYQDLGTRELRGISEEVRVWRVIRPIETESRFAATRASRLTPLIGRSAELSCLMERWNQAQKGRGQVVLLAGEPGIGKSRLVVDLHEQITQDPHVRLLYQCSPHHTNSAFHPVIHQLRLAAGIAGSDSPVTKFGKIEQLLEPNAEDPETAIPLIASLLRIPTAFAYPPLDIPPQQQRKRVIESLVGQVVALSRRHPVLVVVEDAHWADPSMLDFACELIGAVEHLPVLMVITHRMEMDHAWPERAHLTSITLDRVGRRQSIRIARSIGGENLQEETVAEIVRRAEGVPLFVEELTRTVVEWGTRDEEGAEIVPTSLQTSLVARLDRLEDAKQIAQIGSVIGREFRHDLLAALARKSDVEPEDALERLVDSGLVLRRGQPPDATYSFKHALIQDAAYSTVLKRRRKTLHRHIVEVLEDTQRQGEQENIDLLGHHALRAEEWQRAFAYFDRAGRDSMGRSALREAVGHFQQALVAARNLPESPEFVVQIIDLMFELRNALWALGQFAAILDHLDEAERLSLGLNDEVRLGWVSVYRGASLWQLGHSDNAKAAAERGWEIGRAAGALPLEVAGSFYLGCAYVTSGECRTAEQYFERVVEALPGDLAKDKCGLPFAPSIISRSWLVWSYAERGEFTLADRHARLAVELAEELTQPFNRAHIYYDFGYYHLVRGRYGAALRTLTQSVGLIEKWGLTYLAPFTIGFLGYAHVKAGQVGEGLALLEESRERFEKIGLGLFRSLVGFQLADAYLRAGRPADAKAILDDALEIARARGERGHEAYGLFVQGEMARRAQPADEDRALQFYTSALIRAEELGMSPLAARCHLRLGHLLSGTGSSEASEHVLRANEMFDLLGLERSGGGVG